MWKILWIHCNKVIALMTKMISDVKYTCVRKIKHVHCINKFKLLLKLDNTNNSSWLREIKGCLFCQKWRTCSWMALGLYMCWCYRRANAVNTKSQFTTQHGGEWNKEDYIERKSRWNISIFCSSKSIFHPTYNWTLVLFQ